MKKHETRHFEAFLIYSKRDMKYLTPEVNVRGEHVLASSPQISVCRVNVTFSPDKPPCVRLGVPKRFYLSLPDRKFDLSAAQAMRRLL